MQFNQLNTPEQQELNQNQSSMQLRTAPQNDPQQRLGVRAGSLDPTQCAQLKLPSIMQAMQHFLNKNEEDQQHRHCIATNQQQPEQYRDKIITQRAQTVSGQQMEIESKLAASQTQKTGQEQGNESCDEDCDAPGRVNKNIKHDLQQPRLKQVLKNVKTDKRVLQLLSQLKPRYPLLSNKPTNQALFQGRSGLAPTGLSAQLLARLQAQVSPPANLQGSLLSRKIQPSGNDSTNLRLSEQYRFSQAKTCNDFPCQTPIPDHSQSKKGSSDPESPQDSKLAAQEPSRANIDPQGALTEERAKTSMPSPSEPTLAQGCAYRTNMQTASNTGHKQLGLSSAKISPVELQQVIDHPPRNFIQGVPLSFPQAMPLAPQAVYPLAIGSQQPLGGVQQPVIILAPQNFFRVQEQQAFIRQSSQLNGLQQDARAQQIGDQITVQKVLTDQKIQIRPQSGALGYACALPEAIEHRYALQRAQLSASKEHQSPIKMQLNEFLLAQVQAEAEQKLKISSEAQKIKYNRTVHSQPICELKQSQVAQKIFAPTGSGALASQQANFYGPGQAAEAIRDTGNEKQVGWKATIKPLETSSNAVLGSQLLDQSNMNQVTLQLNEASKKASLDPFEDKIGAQSKKAFQDPPESEQVGVQQALNEALNESNEASLIVGRDDLSDEEMAEQVPHDAKIHVQRGINYDMSTVKIEEKIPSTRQFRVYKYKNPRTMRQVKILKCDHKNCRMFFRKWHNFFDHLRVHTGERPFVCPEPGCNQSFTQKANLTKHLAVHSKKSQRTFQCALCYQTYSNENLLKKHLKSAHSHELRSAVLKSNNLHQASDALPEQQRSNCLTPGSHEQSDSIRALEKDLSKGTHPMRLAPNTSPEQPLKSNPATRRNPQKQLSGFAALPQNCKQLHLGQSLSTVSLPAVTASTDLARDSVANRLILQQSVTQGTPSDYQPRATAPAAMSESTKCSLIRAHQKQQSSNSLSAVEPAKLRQQDSDRLLGSMLQPEHSRKKSSMLTQVSLGDLQQMSSGYSEENGIRAQMDRPSLKCHSKPV